MNWRERIEHDPGILHGKPRLRGTQIPVSAVLDNLAARLDYREVLACYPSLSEDDVRACVSWAAEISREQEADTSGQAIPAAEMGAQQPPTEGTLMDLLLSMPDVGEDADFERPVDYGRPDVEWD